MLVVAENYLGGPGVEIGQRCAAPADFKNFCGEVPPTLRSADSLQPFFGSCANGGSDRFAGSGGQFAH
jgi:hypothetical protein